MKFIFNKKVPPRAGKFFLALLYLGLPLFLPLFSWGAEQVLHYGEQTWTLYLNERAEKSFVVIGPWGDTPAFIDRRVDQFWGMGNSFGPVAVYRIDTGMNWTMLNGETGEKLAGGRLFEIGPKDGSVKWVVMTRIREGADVKVVMQSDRFWVFRIGRQGLQILLRQGLLGRP